MQRSLTCRNLTTLSIIIALMAVAAHAQANLSATLTVSPSSETDSQGHQTYTATITNNGVGDAHNLAVSFTMPSIDLPILPIAGACVYSYNGPLFLNCSLGTLAAGASTTVQAVVYPVNVGNLFVTVDASESGGSSTSALVGSTVTGVGIADVAIFLSSTNPGQLGTPITYTLQAINIGDDDAQNVVAELILPVGVNFLSATKGCTHSAKVIKCKVGHMVVNGSATFNINVNPTISGWTFATALLYTETVADPSALNDSVTSRIWVNP